MCFNRVLNRAPGRDTRGYREPARARVFGDSIRHQTRYTECERFLYFTVSAEGLNGGVYLGFTRVKICGITSLKDARLALRLGADYLGFIFIDSRRRIDIACAREIRRAEPRSMLIGVFENASIEEIVETTRAVQLDLVQLHGEESPDFCDNVLSRTGRPVIKTFKASNLPDVRELSRYRTAGYFLFDLDKRILNNPPSQKQIQRVWDVTARKRRKGFRIFLAGALNKDNVREAVRRTGAFGVDVCRGVEKSPGVKDPEALKQFILEARR